MADRGTRSPWPRRRARSWDRDRPGTSHAARAACRGARRWPACWPSAAVPVIRRRIPPLDQILAWADAYHAATGRWPIAAPVPVAEAPGESWDRIDRALRRGRAACSAGSSLARLLAERRGPAIQAGSLGCASTRSWPGPTPTTPPTGDGRSRPLSRWPGRRESRGTGSTGRYAEATRGLPGSSSLAHLLVERRGARDPKGSRRLRIDQIRAWGDAHRVANGRWPNRYSGPIRTHPGETWVNIDEALQHGRRGLPTGTSLAELFASQAEDAAWNRARPRLILDQVLAWADAHYLATGRWPRTQSGTIPGAPGEKWVNINQALYTGCRGLPRGSSLSKLFAGRRAPDVLGPSGGEVSRLASNEERTSRGLVSDR